MPKTTWFEFHDAEMKRLHAKGFTDRQMSRAMDFAPSTIATKRAGLSLPSNQRPKHYAVGAEKPHLNAKLKVEPGWIFCATIWRCQRTSDHNKSIN